MVLLRRATVWVVPVRVSKMVFGGMGPQHLAGIFLQNHALIASLGLRVEAVANPG